MVLYWGRKKIEILRSLDFYLDLDHVYLRLEIDKKFKKKKFKKKNKKKMKKKRKRKNLSDTHKE